jgi:hypothetical protein
MMKARKGFAMMNRKNCLDKMATARLRINRSNPGGGATVAALHRGICLACPPLSR